ncbi:flavin reductase family protein [Natronobeatus ordinarius]|uniref:flavin reductase family protein n=1 Tax=Natronobeatus ordinarius TaxID=2963433 RepID=UPI0020CD67F3|nr:flavin reductase family protein [Natronobeatus ordinarius]
METFAPAAVDTDVNSRVIKSLVSPRPIAWVSTVSPDGVDNLAPFSAYNYVSSSHPLLMVSTGVREDDDGDEELKDTARNAVDTGEFAVNVVTEDVAEAMDRTAAALEPEESEFDAFDLERAPCREIAAPRVADAIATMECSLFETMRVKDRLVLFGEVECVHLADELLTDGEIDATTFETVGRLGGPYYTVGEHADLERR